MNDLDRISRCSFYGDRILDNNGLYNNGTKIMIIDCIGCLHGARPKLEGGDLLIVTGDLTARDSQEELDEFDAWLDSQKYKKKIFIAGNHDNRLTNEKPRKYLEKYGDKEREKFEYLCDSGTEFCGIDKEGNSYTIKIWGMPWSHRFIGINPKCTAFTYFDDASHFDEHLQSIPDDIDILITHEPAFGILDGIPQEDGSLFHVGSKALYNWFKYVGRPKLHIFSHIHEAHGIEEHFPTYDDKMMISVNCSIMNKRYQPKNKPVRIEL